MIVNPLMQPTSPRDFNDVAADVCSEMQSRRNDITDTLKEKARRQRNITANETEIYNIAKEIIKSGYAQYETDTRSKYVAAPWRECAEMVLTTFRNQYFYAPTKLMYEISEILRGKEPPMPPPQAS